MEALFLTPTSLDRIIKSSFLNFSAITEEFKSYEVLLLYGCKLEHTENLAKVLKTLTGIEKLSFYCVDLFSPRNATKTQKAYHKALYEQVKGQEAINVDTLKELLKRLQESFVNFPRVKVLTADEADLGVEGVKVLAEMLYLFPHLKRLSLYENGIGDEGLVSLIKVPQGRTEPPLPSCLVSLDLGNNGITQEGFNSLFNLTPYYESLLSNVVMHLRDRSIGVQPSHWGKLPCWAQNLRTLNIVDHPITLSKEMTESLFCHFPRLKILEMKGAEIAEKDLLAFIGRLIKYKLELLNDNHLDGSIKGKLLRNFFLIWGYSDNPLSYEGRQAAYKKLKEGNEKIATRAYEIHTTRDLEIGKVSLGIRLHSDDSDSEDDSLLRFSDEESGNEES